MASPIAMPFQWSEMGGRRFHDALLAHSSGFCGGLLDLRIRISVDESLPLLGSLRLRELVYEMSEDWPMNSYDLLRRNCCHFCDELSCLLGVGPLPDWVLSLGYS